VTPTPQGVSTTAPDCAARTPSVVIGNSQRARDPSTPLSLASRPPTPLRMTELGAGRNPRRIPWKPESESNSKPPAPAASRKCCSACWQLLQFCHPERSDCFALREAAAQSKDPYPRAVTPTPQGVSTTAPDCAARTPSVVIVSPACKGSFDCVVARFATANSAQDDKRGACTRVKTALGL
jgi:hypothetical protein